MLDKFLQWHAASDGGDYFLGSQYSLAEVLSTGFLQRALVALPHFRGIDLWEILKEHNLSRWGLPPVLLRSLCCGRCPACLLVQAGSRSMAKGGGWTLWAVGWWSGTMRRQAAGLPAKGARHLASSHQ